MRAGLTAEARCRHSRNLRRWFFSTFRRRQQAGLGSPAAGGVVRRVKRYPQVALDGVAQVRLESTHS
jgi:hypothetical protein